MTLIPPLLALQEPMEVDVLPKGLGKRGRPPLPRPCGKCDGCLSASGCTDKGYLAQKAIYDARKARRREYPDP